MKIRSYTDISRYRQLLSQTTLSLIEGSEAAVKDKISPSDIILNLEAAGFDRQAIEKYLDCWECGKVGEQLKLLSAKRDSLLEHVHLREKQIDCLDYLIYLIKKSEESTKE